MKILIAGGYADKESVLRIIELLDNLEIEDYKTLTLDSRPETHVPYFKTKAKKNWHNRPYWEK